MQAKRGGALQDISPIIDHDTRLIGVDRVHCGLCVSNQLLSIPLFVTNLDQIDSGSAEFTHPLNKRLLGELAVGKYVQLCLC